MEPTMMIAFFMEIEFVVNGAWSNCGFRYCEMTDACGL
jgi:hypothetical protein